MRRKEWNRMNHYTTDEMKRFNHLVRETDAAYHEAALRMGMSDSAMQILYILCDSGGDCPLGKICNLSGTSKQTINSALRRLEADGVIRLEMAGSKNKNVILTERTGEESGIIAVETENREGYIVLDGEYTDLITNKKYSGKTGIEPYGVLILKK